MQKETFEIVTSWSWKPERLALRIRDIRGGSIPENIQRDLIQKDPPDLDSKSKLYQSGKMVAEYIGRNVPVPPPIDLGGNTQIIGEITGISTLYAGTSENPDHVSIKWYVEYSNGLINKMVKSFNLEELPEFIQALINQIHHESNVLVRKWFWGQYGKGEINPAKWKAEKLEVFISYRESGSAIAEQLFDALGIFEKSSTFLPRIDKVDLQAGNWLDQLMDMIDRSPIFIPILTTDYLDGPIARPELDQALRQTLNQQGKRIVPILVEGSPKDYENHFIGGFQMIIAKDGLSKDIVKKVAYMCLGISSNPYE